MTHVQSSQLVQLVLDPAARLWCAWTSVLVTYIAQQPKEVAKTITMAKACRVFSTYGAVASINLSLARRGVGTVLCETRAVGRPSENRRIQGATAPDTDWLK